MTDLITLSGLCETPVSEPLEVLHTLYECPLYVWSASAHGRTWLYVEYRDGRGASRYACFRFAQADEVMTFIEQLLPTESLAGIDPEATRERPIAASARRARA
ncbi:hypothetical protein AAIA72_08845 [Hahella sp. SMD15-11]|uniref:Uncharacterized protein n=1 Tax=Thermohahella caldifontis TaxID=3142973 RepID=A0AB39US94_9GAMM